MQPINYSKRWSNDLKFITSDLQVPLNLIFDIRLLLMPHGMWWGTDPLQHKYQPRVEAHQLQIFLTPQSWNFLSIFLFWS